MNLVEELRDDFLVCNICLEEYEEPKQLPCLHTFCRRCLAKYIAGKVVETGSHAFPCPFCRKAIQLATTSGEEESWADSFPTNFLLSQLSCKLKEKEVTDTEPSGPCANNAHDLPADREFQSRVKCSDHPQCGVVGYCRRQRRGVCEECCVQRHADCIHTTLHHTAPHHTTSLCFQCGVVGYCRRQRRGVCEECCVQRHADCIRSHVREREVPHLAEEKRAQCRQALAAVQIKLEGLTDGLAVQESDLACRTQQLTAQTQAALADLRVKLDLAWSQQERELTSALDTSLAKETQQLQTTRYQAAELAKSVELVSEKVSAAVDGGGASVKDLAVLERAEEELRKQEQAVEKLRKGCCPVEILFHPSHIPEKVLKGLTAGTVSVDVKPPSRGGARPRVQRYVSDPSSSVSGFLDPVSLPAQRISPDMLDEPPPPRRTPRHCRALSPPGAGASSLSTSPPEGPASGECQTHHRHRSEGLVTLSTRRTPTVPDFGSVLIEESRRSRSAPRRPRPASEGASTSTSTSCSQPRRRGVPMETAIDDSPERERSCERNARAETPGRERTPQNGPSRPEHPGGNARQERVTTTTITDPPQTASEEALSSDSNVTFVTSPASGNSGATTTTQAEREEQAGSDSEAGVQAAPRRIVCVRHFMASHGSDVKNHPGLVGICAVCQDRVAVSDRWNKVVKLLDISGRVMDVLAVPGGAEPWDLTLRRPGVLAVTYPKEQKIRMVDVVDEASRLYYRSHFIIPSFLPSCFLPSFIHSFIQSEQKIRMVDVVDGASRLYYRSHFITRDGYASLAAFDPTTLIASVCPPFGSPKVHLIDYMGAVLRALDCSQVAYPRCVDVCADDQICVSDWTHHNVKIFPRDGSGVRWTYSGVPGAPDAQLKAPMGLAWNGRDHVFIVDGRQHKLHAVCAHTGACAAVISLPQSQWSELKLVTFVDASPELCRSERALVVTTTTGSVQVYDLGPNF
ncbi:hypothetical protein ACOMHN_001464 [Nucella lapillus]